MFFWRLFQYSFRFTRCRDNGLTKAQMIDHVGQVGHGGIQIVILGLGFNVKVPGDAIDEQVTTDLTGWMVGTGLLEELTFLVLLFFGRIITLFLIPFLELVIHIQLAFSKTDECRDGTIHLVVGRDAFPIMEPSKSRKGHDFLFATQVGLLDAIDLANPDGHASIFHFGCQLFPGGCQLLTPNTPRSVHVNKCHFIGCNPFVKGRFGQIHSMELTTLFLMKFLQRFPIIIMSDFSCFAIAS
mmetsp:Transcript_19409/g.32237  ORF Transcript_19409/g.32237 Transcript_19409/m.32237 type:complete len:241 (+) Transcript_19409:517-1239(+)